MKNPWNELQIQNMYWNGSLASPIAMKPNAHVIPERQNVLFIFQTAKSAINFDFLFRYMYFIPISDDEVT